MAEAPKAECDRGKAAMTRNAASSSWAADVTPLLSDIGTKGVVSLMIVPAGAGAVPVGFDVQFAKPQLQAELAPETDTSSSSSSSDFGGSDFGSSSSSGGFSSSSTSPSSGGFDTSATTPPPTTAQTFAIDNTVPTADLAASGDASAAGASGGSVISTTPNSGELAALPTPLPASSRGNHGLQAAFFVALAVLAGAAAGFARWMVRRQSR
jgi:cytoskeletal protein RodZ